MPIIKAAKKHLRQTIVRKERNLERKKTMRVMIKSIKDLMKKGEKEEAQNLIPVTTKAIDKAAKRGIIKKNNASRKKSFIARITQKVKK